MESRFFAVSGGDEVFQSREEALALWKRLSKTDKSARFKGFSNEEEAKAFACAEGDVVDGGAAAAESKTTTDSDPGACTFPKLKVPSLNIFRIAMEKNEESKVKSLLDENTRYLIECSGDVPVLLHKGCHYNALHVCAKKNLPAMTKYVLDTIGSSEFWRRTYPLDSDEVMEQRSSHLLDLYLHAHDKGRGYTAMHFASDMGHPDVLEVLLAHPKADSSRLSRDSRSISEVACEHGPEGDEERTRLKAAINDLLAGQFYVPILRPMDGDASPAILGRPFSPSRGDSPLSSVETTPVDQSHHPSSPLRLSGIAGPMSPSRANEFYSRLKRPKCQSERQAHKNVLRSDCDRGLERLGRDLARRHGVAWQERWAFLQAECDMSSDGGLQKLEDFFAEREKDAPTSPVTPPPPSSLSSDSGVDSVDFHTPTRDPASSQAHAPSTSAAVSTGKGTDAAVEDLLARFEKATIATDNATVGASTGVVASMGNSPALVMTSCGDGAGSDGGSGAAGRCSSMSDVAAAPYVCGFQPSKHDQDVLLALGMTDIDPSKFPRVAEWQQRVQSHSLAERSKWKTPVKRRPVTWPCNDASPLASPSSAMPKSPLSVGGGGRSSMTSSVGGASPYHYGVSSPGDRVRQVSLQERTALNRSASPRRLDKDFNDLLL